MAINLIGDKTPPTDRADDENRPERAKYSINKRRNKGESISHYGERARRAGVRRVKREDSQTDVLLVRQEDTRGRRNG